MLLKIINWIKDKWLYYNIPEDLWADFYWEFEADPRDFKVEQVLWEPTEEELKNLPIKVDLLAQASPKYYLNQGCLKACTAYSITNTVVIQECIERKNSDIEWKPCYIRQKAWHKCVCKWEHWDYLENICKTVKQYWVKVEITNYNPLSIETEYLKIDWYAFWRSEKKNMMYRLSKGYPLYYAFRWNRTIWHEMLKWEIKTWNYTPTWWHAVTAYWYDQNYLYFINSWKPNYKDKHNNEYSIFKISWANLQNMLNRWLANWRFRVIYNHKDESQQSIELFPDYKVQSWEWYKSVKWAKDNWIVKWVLHSDWKRYLEPWRPISRLEAIIMLKRMYDLLLKNK